jgi:hypothetical protein
VIGLIERLIEIGNNLMEPDWKNQGGINDKYIFIAHGPYFEYEE